MTTSLTTVTDVSRAAAWLNEDAPDQAIEDFVVNPRQGSAIWWGAAPGKPEPAAARCSQAVQQQQQQQQLHQAASMQ